LSATSISMLPDWVSAPETARDSSASRTPPLMDIVEARVPASDSFNDPAVTVIAPDKVLPEAIELVLCSQLKEK